jgi:tetratricopeptide (TPR) repeat protein
MRTDSTPRHLLGAAVLIFNPTTGTRLAPLDQVLRFLIILFGTLFLLSLAAPAPAQQPLEEARDLYAAARYEESLALLNRLRQSAGVSPLQARNVEQYRSLCLLALGRQAEAREAIAAAVVSDPMYMPSEEDASPRVREAFDDVRRQMLPEIIAREYAAAKTTFERKEYDAAIDQFRRVLVLLDEPVVGGRLQDLRTLTDGFLQLSVGAQAAADAAARPAAEAPPDLDPPSGLQALASTGDAGVVPPVTVRQDLPRLPSAIPLTSPAQGLLELIISEEGTVESATLVNSVHRVYDPLLLNAARIWRYQAATRHGVPVRFRKVIQVNLDPAR